ncbi:Ca2+-dependent phosphoinositide-specific phospholipase C [Xanthomonas cissicola]|uniref:Ca2+-dependent phosphoinositide-specific phospholipase C n=1 Tax=Xanthomonas cissicola TaxID=86186 RepID=UPI003CCD6119
MDALDAEVRSVFQAGEYISPDQVRGRAPTLNAAVLAHGWPSLAQARGRVPDRD